ncbi:MAG: fluoride efflux transporter CrcB [Cyclobacteriaceae bacterium]|nr:fluoride efflux transporter CrcB [Cyclobacteriaceae bacterium]
MLKISLIIGVGGFLGSVSRYWLSLFIDKNFFGAYPYGTFTVNLIGCFLLGIIYALADKEQILSHEMRFFLATGFCGSFTTFSTFSYENHLLYQEGEWATLITYISLSVVIGLLAAFGGVAIGKLY